MYRYETHLHTDPVSRCAKVGVKENLEFYKKLGYDGVFITNHFLDGNINIDKEKSYEEKLEFYFSDYEKGLEIGKTLGIKVFLGVELSDCGTDYLVYGLDREWFRAHPEIMDMEKREELALMMESGALIIHAHPFRGATGLDHLPCLPENIHGFEIENASRTEEENRLAALYAQRHGLLTFAGSDNHFGAGQKKLAGVCFAEPVCDVRDFVEKVKGGKGEIFTTDRL